MSSGDGSVMQDSQDVQLPTPLSKALAKAFFAALHGSVFAANTQNDSGQKVFWVNDLSV